MTLNRTKNRNRTKKLTSLILFSGVIALAGCETTNGNKNSLKKGFMGAVAGAAAGAIIGNNAGDGDAKSGALIGAIIGGAGGAYAGCREDGGCGTKPKYHRSVGQYGQTQTYRQQADKRYYFDSKTGRYYYYNSAKRR
ncbi:MAG: glycine zipper domain-containing protein [Robiginitomaculum sp.]